MSDIKTVLADAEDLLKQAASATGERASELRETALTRLKQAKEKAADAQVVVIEKGKKAARATDDFVHERPWASIGIAAGSRRRRWFVDQSSLILTNPGGRVSPGSAHLLAAVCHVCRANLTGENRDCLGPPGFS